MRTVRFDAVIVGAGQAGPPLAARLSGAGRRVAIVERDKFGGTCVNNGCTPTKALIASAYAAHLTRRAAEFGIDVGDAVRVDMPRVKARKDAIVERFRGGVEQWVRGLANCTVYRGSARFVAPRAIEVGADMLEADRVYLDVGGRPLVPAMPGVDAVHYLTSETIMETEALPGHLIVIGGSYVGLEFAQMYRRFGSRVTVVEMGHALIGREDPDVSQAVRDILAAEDIDVRVDAKCIALEPDEAGAAVRLDCAEGPPRVSGTHVLLAVGRVPNTDGLGLEQAGVTTDERGYIRVDDELRTSAEGVYALGDCNGRGAFTHTAYNDYEIVADNLLENAGRKVTDRLPVYALFTDPPLGRVGLTVAQAKRDGRRLLVGKRPMTRVARALEKSETQGFIKIVVDADTRRIVGAAILGTGGDEAIHSVLDAMGAGLPEQAVRRGVRIHPTVSELIPTVLGDLQPAESSD